MIKMFKLLRSKNATMLLLPIIVGFIIGLTVFLITVSHEQSKKSSSFIGEKQLILLDNYQKVQQHLLFIDLAAKQSSEKAVLDLAESFGFSEQSPCGEYLDYSVVNNLTDFCMPGDLRLSFSKFFNVSFSRYLNFYTKLYIPRSLYSLSLIKTNYSLEVLGFANDFLDVPIVSSKSGFAEGDICSLPQNLVPIVGVVCSSTYSSCELNNEVVERLKQAESIAEGKGYTLLVTSARRTYQQQAILFNMYGAGRASRPSCTSAHIGGKAVDVVLFKNGVPANGMSADEGAMNDLSIGSRGDLQGIMCEAGFQRFSGEFWHFEYKTPRWKDSEGKMCVLS